MHRHSHTSEVKASEKLQTTEVYEQRAKDPYLATSKYLRGGMKILSNGIWSHVTKGEERRGPTITEEHRTKGGKQ